MRCVVYEEAFNIEPYGMIENERSIISAPVMIMKSDIQNLFLPPISEICKGLDTALQRFAALYYLRPAG